MPVPGAVCPTLSGVLCSYFFLFALKGALQELKLYGTPYLAEVQCDNAFQVRTKFVLRLLYNKVNSVTFVYF
jgi:hypothetical protein